MQMEDLLAARRFIELLEQKPLGFHASHDRAHPTLCTDGMNCARYFASRSRSVRAGAFGMTSVWPSMRGITSMKASDTSSS